MFNKRISAQVYDSTIDQELANAVP